MRNIDFFHKAHQSPYLKAFGWMLLFSIPVNMVTVTIKLKLVFLFIKYAVLDKGSTKDVFVNAKNYCPRAAMRAYFVKSDIQCTHRCLRKKCKLLNYKKKAKDIENCEIFSDIGDCSVIPDQEGWKAMIFEVKWFWMLCGLSNSNLYSWLFTCYSLQTLEKFEIIKNDINEKQRELGKLC